MSATHNTLHVSGAQPICPCCGQPVPMIDELVLDDVLNIIQLRGRGLQMEPLKFRMLEMLTEARPGFVDTYDLLEHAFHRTARELDGMPYSKASMLVKVQICQLRRVLPAIGLGIQSKGRRPTLYRLVENSQQVAA
ncbi:MAG: hypothetical protein AAFO61_04870 [Pseudomonadota bacterium]